MGLKIDKFERKRCQKKRKDVNYQLLYEFFHKYFVVHEWSAVKNLFSTNVWSKVDSCFCEAVYKVTKKKNIVHIKEIPGVGHILILSITTGEFKVVEGGAGKWGWGLRSSANEFPYRHALTK